ncbi:MAG TPA: TlpA disulfide reductase family protein [Acidimicrobiales bacterium]|nr:TlpA disulfide reductase family protein [Acidimicrobiales bacterium]
MKIAPIRARVAALVVGAVCIALIVVFALRTVGGTRATTTPLGGSAAKAISGTNILNGTQISLQTMRGRYVIVDFFASWCSACLSEEPQIEAFTFANRNDRTIGFIGVDIDDSINNARGFFSRYGATWTAVVDTTGSIAQSYGVAQPPELFLVDPRGKIVSSISQPVTATELTNWIREAKVAGA